MYIIGIHGHAGAGKTTLKDMLTLIFEDLTKSRYSVQVLPFAKALKDLAISMGWNGKKDEKGRRLLQLLGTEVCRECLDEEYWIKKWLDAYSQILADNMTKLIIVDDVRFWNEQMFLKKMNAVTLKIVGRHYDDVDFSHPSEQELEDVMFTRIIKNSNTLANLRLQATEVLKEMLHWTY